MTMPVESVPAAAPTMGLLASSRRPPGEGWEMGFSWRPEQCLSYQGFDPCGIPVGVPAIANNELSHYLPPGFRMRDTCSTLSGVRDTERLRRQVEAATDYVVAHELWTGELARANPGQYLGTPYSNAYLTDGTAVEVTVTGTAVERLATLEEAAMVASRGQQVMLHMPPSMVLPLGEKFTKTGQLLLTPLGNIVVADAGYTGAGDYVPGVSEVQTVTITGVPTGGTWTGTYNGQTTGPIAFNASAATFQTALVALSNIAPGDISVTGPVGGPYVVTFTAPGNVNQMTADGALLTGGTAPAVGVVTTTPGSAPSQEAGEWVYATGVVGVRLSSIDFIDGVRETVQRAINSQEIWGQRFFAATYDPCVHLSANMASS